MIDFLKEGFRVSIRRACRAVPACRATYRQAQGALRKADPRTVEDVWQRIGEFLERFTPGECAAYFRNAGYAPI